MRAAEWRHIPTTKALYTQTLSSSCILRCKIPGTCGATHVNGCMQSCSGKHRWLLRLLVQACIALFPEYVFIKNPKKTLAFTRARPRTAICFYWCLYAAGAASWVPDSITDFTPQHAEAAKRPCAWGLNMDLT